MKLKITKLILTLTTGLLPLAANAGFSLPSGSTSPGHGISNVLSGSIANAALYWQSTTNWLNAGNPITTFTTYAVTNDYNLPACDSVSVARIVMTVWGGTANYISQMTVTINGTNLSAANPLVFGSTTDTNPVFSANSANTYGSGSGVWLVTLPVPPEMLLKDGTPNTIIVSQTSPNGFDGRVQHVTLLAVYQKSSLANTFDYAIAEGGGDIYKTPTGSQVSQRTVALDPVNPTGAIAAKLQVLYTYGDALNDRLYFNGTQLGSDNVADWSTAVVNNGPSIVSFDVLGNLVATNTVTFSLGADVPATQETSLRPQLAALAVTRPAAVPLPSLAINSGGQIAWTTNSAGFSLESNTNLVGGTWTAVTNVPVVSGDQFTVTVEMPAPQQFFRLKKSN
ncbi:MAG TPA: DUF3344 domain-containing protein [Verrucomicrobiota bacterium]|nr:DUF3344 domain-containing protein [Verrucomicrobiota bacterium]